MRRKSVYLALVPVIVVVCPWIVGPFWTQIMLLTGLYAICILGLSLLIGHAGLVSLAQAAFWGIGAYVSAFLSLKHGFPTILALMSGLAVAGIVAFLLGWLTRRLAGHYLTLVTLGAGMIMNLIFVEESWWTGGASGLIGIPHLSLGSWVIDSDLRMYYLVWGILGLVMVLIWNLLHSPWGRTLQATRDSSTAASATGVDVGRFKVQAFVASGVLAALSGALYAHYMTFVSPELFSFKQSILFLLMAVVGGPLSIWGPIIGALVLTGLTEALRSVMPMFGTDAVGPLETLIFGVLLLVVILFLPSGVMSLPAKAKIVRGEGKPWRRYSSPRT
ncbi:branched-chain amino acid ABC transporter permease [Kyrpidia spormannii]|uniref:Branched-chain amino acid ABC transporter permease n=2 Tax=Kyrpidia spormannii TaxID=2055160 RepID=A0ACA8Z8W0_9BACL|nr:branched-chain amino acid ABC transporter permease [Kyrpidia spormannii]CAB3392254.1 Branched-chain amino acid ABC transporter permease [Kyrpidia spormannii]CAB3393176.1 Branched-chain amino acid ABC transporter permease [Kyrpidia spormannii]